MQTPQSRVLLTGTGAFPVHQAKSLHAVQQPGVPGLALPEGSSMETPEKPTLRAHLDLWGISH